jgi:hypothetical protein
MISTHPRQIYWLDSDRVLFAGQRGLPPSGKHGLGIYLWDLRTNSISLYAEGSTLCYFQGFIRYLTSGRGGQAMIVEGRFGEEKIRPRWPEDETSHQSPSDCRVYPSKTVPRNEFGFALVPLAEGYGFLDFGNQRTAFPFRSWPIVLLREIHGPSVNLPIESREVAFNKIEYAPHLRAHVLYGMQPKGGGGSWPAGRAQPIYLLDGNGTVQIRTIPYGPWIGGQAVVYAAPTARGLFFTSHQVVNRLSTGGHAGGAYVVEAGRVRQLVSGIPESARVSPDGCRAAWALSRHPSKDRLITMQAAELCNQREEALS